MNTELMDLKIKLQELQSRLPGTYTELGIGMAWTLELCQLMTEISDFTLKTASGKEIR